MQQAKLKSQTTHFHLITEHPQILPHLKDGIVTGCPLRTAKDDHICLSCSYAITHNKMLYSDFPVFLKKESLRSQFICIPFLVSTRDMSDNTK